MQLGFLMQCFGLILTVFLIGFLIRKYIIDEQKESKKLSDQCLHLEAEILSRKLKDSNVEIAVKKPQSFKTKRKPQKRLSK